MLKKWLRRVCSSLLFVGVVLVAGAGILHLIERHQLPKELLAAATGTLSRLNEESVWWTVIYEAQGRPVFKVKALRTPEERRWGFFSLLEEEEIATGTIIGDEESWYVSDAAGRRETRPWEAALQIPHGYFLIESSDLRVVSDADFFKVAKLKELDDEKAVYAVPLKDSDMAKVIPQLEETAESDPDNELLQKTLKEMKERVRRGDRMIVDRKTGIILSARMQGVEMRTTELQWYPRLPRKFFERKEVSVKRTEPPKKEIGGDTIMVMHDPFAGDVGKLTSEQSCYLNVATGEMRRVPYRGSAIMFPQFAADRQSVYAISLDVFGQRRLVEIELSSGETETLIEDAQGFIFLGELSPDRKYLPILQMPDPSRVLMFQVQLYDLEMNSLRTIGRPGKWGGPTYWTPEGDGLILNRFEKAGMNEIERRVICRMDLEGEVKDLRNGDSPLVLRKSGKILFEDQESGLWYLCDLDGGRAELYADGMGDHFMPSVSPEERRILFMKKTGGELPELLLFDFGSSDGKRVHDHPGFVGMPTWR